ncbi:MAG TPA: hypothetical protein VFR85_04215 [Anaeromyxobacteraceae bacterium]|nr:hypothetical protein [Anaeromyxobacteraceae bacterium]
MRPWHTATGLAVLAALALAACGPLTPGERAAEEGLSAQNGLSPNGLSQNGLSQNGLSQNGLSQNGLSQNGLSQNGLGSDFSKWFNQDVATSDAVMRYLVRCAVPSGQTRTWTNPATGAGHTWPGDLGVAPGWAAGAAATAAEQQLISACLAAHVNAYGISVPISVNGKTATGDVIPHAKDERAAYTVYEGAFFGNLFADEGVFVCQKHPAYTSAQSSARACALDTTVIGPSAPCAPLQNVGECSAVCSAWSNINRMYGSCAWKGVSYKPLTTLLQPSHIYACGDGTCQFTESCGEGSSWDSCNSDCGSCL